jgi:hypothetical protein
MGLHLAVDLYQCILSTSHANQAVIGPVYWVPRCLGWIETSSRGQPHVELAGEQVDDCFEVAS